MALVRAVNRRGAACPRSSGKRFTEKASQQGGLRKGYQWATTNTQLEESRSSRLGGNFARSGLRCGGADDGSGSLNRQRPDKSDSKLHRKLRLAGAHENHKQKCQGSPDQTPFFIDGVLGLDNSCPEARRAQEACSLHSSSEQTRSSRSSHTTRPDLVGVAPRRPAPRRATVGR